MNNPPKLDVVTTLRLAASLVRARGLSQGNWYSPQLGLCANAAIGIASGDVIHWLIEARLKNAVESARPYPVAKAFVEAAKLKATKYYSEKWGEVGGAICAFNNEWGRTAEDVATAFEAAATSIENSQSKE